ncbi:MAG: hypothetical protein NTZ50_07460 [Chloroflexi bacterium]|nr:hypothetical protein [Chloroflexota bacterium]
MADVIFDKQDQLDKITSALLPGEKIEAVFDLKGTGTGFLGITNLRIIVYDQAFLQKMKAVVSVPYLRVLAVAAEDSNSILAGRGFFSSSKIHIITTHSEYAFEFRGADKAHIAHDLVLGHIVGK